MPAVFQGLRTAAVFAHTGVAPLRSVAQIDCRPICFRGILNILPATTAWKCNSGLMLVRDRFGTSWKSPPRWVEGRYKLFPATFFDTEYMDTAKLACHCLRNVFSAEKAELGFCLDPYSQSAANRQC